MKHKCKNGRLPVRHEDAVKGIRSARPRESLVDGVPVTNWFKGPKDDAIEYFTVQIVQLADGGCSRKSWEWEYSERYGWRIIRTDLERTPIGLAYKAGSQCGKDEDATEW